MNKEDQSLKGFNAGYIIQKHEPHLARKVLADLENSDDAYMQGFVAGAKEYQLEIELEKSNFFPGMDEAFNTRELNKEIQPEKDDKDLEIDI